MAVPAVIPASNRVPGVYLRVSLGVGVRSAGDNPRTILLLANKTSAGVGTPDTVVYDIPDEETAISLGGVGSELHRSYRAIARANPSAIVKAIIVTESAGTAASATVTFTGSATASGTLRMWIAGEYVDLPIASGDANTASATALKNLIEDQSAWPVTVGVAAGVVTITAKHKGPRGNSIGCRVELFDVTGQTAVATGSGYLTAGATSDTPAAALTTALAARYTYIASGYDDATNLGLLKAQVDAKDEPEVGKRERVIAAFVGSYANGITLATGLNSPRVHVAQCVGCESPTSEIAGALAGLVSRMEDVSCAMNMDGLEVPGIVTSPRIADAPSNGNRVNAVNSGITLLAASAPSQPARVLRFITSKSLDASAQPDYRVLDASKVAVPDFLADELQVFLADRFPNANIGPDVEGQVPPPGVVTPSMAEDAIFERLLAFDVSNPTAEKRLIENVSARRSEIVVEIATSPAGRFNFVAPVDVVEGAHQWTGDLRQIG
jgi:phage tail sheath gpL-like